MNIPKELYEISELLHTQNNRCTADPIFMLQEKRRVYGLSHEYSNELVWIDMEDGCDELPDPENDEQEIEYENNEFYELVGFYDEWIDVKPFFTEKAALNYIDYNSHRHSGELRTYAESLYRNPEMIAIRNFLLSLTNQRTEPQQKQ